MQALAFLLFVVGPIPGSLQIRLKGSEIDLFRARFAKKKQMYFEVCQTVGEGRVHAVVGVHRGRSYIEA